MSKDDLAEQINEQDLGNKAGGIVGLLCALGVKYGIPSLVCAWLFYVVSLKDQQIFTMAEKVTSALVESNHARGEEAEAKKETADAIRDLAEAVKGMR